MKLLNSKSVINCIDSELENHAKESEEILKKLLLYNDYDWAAIFKYFDAVHKDEEPVIKSCNLHDCEEMMQFADIKNGVDLAEVEGFLTFICYGSEYQIDNQTYIVTTGIQIRPFDEARNFISLDLDNWCSKKI